MKKIVLLSFSFATLFATAQNIKVDNGKSFKIISTMDLTGELMGNEMKNSTNTTAQFKITGTDGDFYKASNTVTKMVITGNMMGQDINFDSDKKEDLDSQMGQMLAGKLNKSVEVKINKNTGKQEIISLDDAAEGGMGSMMGGGNNSSSIFFVIPADKKIGDKWVETKDNDGLKETNSYEYQSLKDNIATILVLNTVKGTTNKEINGQSMDMTIDSKGTVFMLVETTTNIIKKTESNLDTTTNMEVAGQSMAVSNKIKTTTTVE